VLWIPLAAWLIALVVAAGVLGFLGYEITWRIRRLLGELRHLQELGQALAQLQSDATNVQQRLERAGSS
jgi:hypothetical protein